MASKLPGCRRMFHHVRVGSFYSLFFSVVIIFTTIIYIQVVSQFNIPLDSTTDSRGNNIPHDIDLVMIFTTREYFRNNSWADSLRTVYNISKTKNNKTDINTFPSNSSSIHVVQSILRSYDVIRGNRTENFSAVETLHNLNESKHFNKSDTFETHVRLDNESVVDVSVEKIHVNLTEERKTVVYENELPNANGFGASLLSVNISKYNISYLNDKQIERNATAGRRRVIRSRNSKRPNYCPLWPPELSK